jgi:TolB-like protein
MKLFILFILPFCVLLADRPLIILVNPFVNNGNSHSWLSAGITDTVTNDLKNIGKVTVISQEDRKKALNELKYKQQMGQDEEALEIANLTGADIIFTGSYTVLEDSIRVIAKITNTKSGAIEKSIKIDGKIKDLFSLYRFQM